MSPKTLIIAAVALAASSAATLPALAAPGDTNAKDRPMPLRASIMFNLIDTNGDGSIDTTEAATLQKAIFAAFDANKDGKLTPDEFKKVADGFMERKDGPRGQFMGRGGPGRFGPGMGPGFHRNGPGGDRQGQLQGQQGPDGQQLGQNDDGQPPEGAPPAPRDFASLDKNGDGVVSPDEFAAGMPDLPGIPPVQQQ